jgi:hypothetical protein
MVIMSWLILQVLQTNQIIIGSQISAANKKYTLHKKHPQGIGPGQDRARSRAPTGGVLFLCKVYIVLHFFWYLLVCSCAPGLYIIYHIILYKFFASRGLRLAGIHVQSPVLGK